jgi:enamine deaminase RidA (YjgF/YER057c/UK114 family)
MNIERIRSAPRMSQAVVHNNTVYLAGQVALDAVGQSVTEQMRNILDRTDSLLAEAGVTKRDVLSVTIWLADMGHFEEMNAVWDAWVPPDASPARATVGAPLAAAGFSVEVAFIAARRSTGPTPTV